MCGGKKVDFQVDFCKRTCNFVCKECGFIDKYLIDGEITTKIEFPDNPVVK